LKVTTTITNVGDETLKLLNGPRGALNSFPENSFTITNPTGSFPSFNGAKVDHMSDYPTNTCTHAFGFRPRSNTALHTPLALVTPVFLPFSVLAPPSTSPTIVSRITSITFDFNVRSLTKQPSSVSATYNFTRSGAGHYSIEPSNLLTYVDADGTPKDIRATVEDVAKVKLSGNLAVSRAHDKRISYASCSYVEQVLAMTAAGNAGSYARGSY